MCNRIEKDGPARPRVMKLRVVANQSIAAQVMKISLAGEEVADLTWPGQFVHIKCGEGSAPLLRRPLSICDVRLDRKELVLIYRIQGEGTRWLASLDPDDHVDLLAPLGKGFPVDERKPRDQVLLIGGGVGIPPLYYLSKVLNSRGVKVTHLLGFNRREEAFLAEEFAQLGSTYLTTRDGSLGERGLVTDLVQRWPLNQWQAIYACGPLPMLKAVERLWLHSPVAVYLSLEKRMACGLGACLACVCPSEVGDQAYRKVCSDGPVFRLGEVII